jgi:alcohol dehydrogenase class IV
MGYSLTYFKNIDHGRANGLLLGEYLRLVDEKRPDLTAKILSEMKLPNVDALEELLERLLGTKETLSPEEIGLYTQIAVKSKNIANGVVIPSEEEIRRMFIRSLGK